MTSARVISAAGLSRLVFCDRFRDASPSSRATGPLAPSTSTIGRETRRIARKALPLRVADTPVVLFDPAAVALGDARGHGVDQVLLLLARQHAPSIAQIGPRELTLLRAGRRSLRLLLLRRALRLVLILRLLVGRVGLLLKLLGLGILGPLLVLL